MRRVGKWSGMEIVVIPRSGWRRLISEWKESGCIRVNFLGVVLIRISEEEVVVVLE